MRENGRFRPKKGFTMIPNEVARSNELSYDAKGLYLHIMSHITSDTFPPTKSLLLSESLEEEKAFEQTWKELKQKGYLREIRLRNPTGGEGQELGGELLGGRMQN